MQFLKRFVENHADFFIPVKDGEKAHPHDIFMANTLLKLIPHTVTPNQVTFFRVVATPFVFLLTLYEYYVIGIIAFLFLALTDVIDGSMARTRNQITKFGMMFDPLADKLLIGSMVLLIVFDNYNFWLGVAVLGLEIVFIVVATVSNYAFKTVYMANLWGKIKMILQVIAVFLTLAGLLLNAPQFFVVGAWVFGAAIGFAIVSLFYQGI